MADYTHIKIAKDGLSVGSRKLKKDEVVPVVEISAEAAERLVKSKRAAPVSVPAKVTK